MSDRTTTRTRTEQEVEVDQKVQAEDVDDIIGLAARMKDADEDTLTLAEVEEVGLELGLAPEYIQKATTELQLRRQKAEAEARHKAQARARLLKIGAASVAAVVALLAIMAGVGQASLNAELAEVQQKRAQVVSVIERQEATEQRWKDRENSPERDAELSGAENRVRVERRRYDEAAADYNASSQSFPGSMWVNVFGLPDRVPLSNEITAW